MQTTHSKTIMAHGQLLSLERPQVMTIVNMTPDSFYAGSRAGSCSQLEARVREMLPSTDIFDVGGYSSRPGAQDISTREEYDRLAPGLELLRRVAPQVPVSVDTFRAEVARKVVSEFGVEIINDISGGDLDAEMWPAVAELGVAYVLMHMRGNPQTMQSMTDYADVTAEVLSDLAFKTARLNELGVSDVIIDPGFGFAKTLEQNYQLLANLEVFRSLGCPVLVGVSRKSMVCKPLDITPSESLCATTALQTLALTRGADILRVHDPLQAAQAIRLVELMNRTLKN